ncbi:hypothetical protein [Cellulomonas cellasea]|uniref:Uncharacterized protein n=1 Tax=Cellulomonas cellasea TaxID=43670 RepID=A0A7W4UGC6_9CELL|nr:hypothetical protein [Cellulomonas cellasea]MBB2923691.1 hypothetical protein [Cellulomonas cellasea]
MAYPCPRCGHHVLVAPPGTGEDCPVCATRDVPTPDPRADPAPPWAPLPGPTLQTAEPHLNGAARIGRPATPEADPAPEQFPTPHVPGWGPRRPDRLITPRGAGTPRTRSRPGVPRLSIRPGPSRGTGDVRAGGAGPGAPGTPARPSSTSRVRAVVGPGAAALRQQGARVRIAVTATDDLLTDDHLWLARRWAPRVAAVALVLTLLSTGPLHGVLTVATVLAVLVLVTAWVWTWWRLGPRRWWVLGGEERRAELARIHDDAVAASEAPGIELVRVRRVQQTATHGSRCLVETAEGASRDAWFWHDRPRRGAVLLVRAQPANPAHTSDLHLLHVGSEATGSGIVQRLPRASWRAGGRARRTSGRAHRRGGAEGWDPEADAPWDGQPGSVWDDDRDGEAGYDPPEAHDRSDDRWPADEGRARGAHRPAEEGRRTGERLPAEEGRRVRERWPADEGHVSRRRERGPRADVDRDLFPDDRGLPPA